MGRAHDLIAYADGWLGPKGRRTASTSTKAAIGAFAAGYRVRDNGVVQDPNGHAVAVTIKNSWGTTDRRPGRAPRAPRAGGFHQRLRFKVGSAEVYVHKLAAFQWYGVEAFRKGTHIRHLNGNSLDNRFGNLEPGSQTENEKDKRRARRAARAREWDRAETHPTFGVPGSDG